MKQTDIRRVKFSFNPPYHIFKYIILALLGPVLSLAVAPDGDYCFSGGIDATIRCWNMPHSTVDPYDSYGKKKCEKQIRIIHAFNNILHIPGIYTKQFTYFQILMSWQQL